MLLVTIAFCMLMEEIGFYIVHSTLHLKHLYPYIHKQHHEAKQVISIANNYFHPIEYILLRYVGAAGPLALGKHIHIWTVMCWNLVRTLESIESHSGYEFPWSPFRLLPFASSAQYHDFHHSRNVGNYGTFFTIFDTVFGTNRDYYIYLD